MWQKDLKADHEGIALIFGARSWVGYRLSDELIKSAMAVVGTTTQSTEDLPKHFGDSATLLTVNTTDEVTKLVAQCKPRVVVNLRYGVDQKEFEFHQAAAAASEKANAPYVYSSSALALDGYGMDHELVEELPVFSVSDYGKFKGKCELDLIERTGLQSLALRFSSIHGWSPWKDCRTEALLKQISVGETVQVAQRIVQNRMSDRFLAETICSLILKQAVGVAHIGTSDSSEEVDFLGKLANTFGYAAQNIYKGTTKPLNLAVVPNLGMHPSGPKTETDTLNDLLDRPELARYKNPSTIEING